MPGRPGAALIALKARVPVVPCYIHDAPYDGTMLGNRVIVHANSVLGADGFGYRFQEGRQKR